MSYELLFYGGVPIDYRRNHDSYAGAEAEAYRVLEWLTMNGHPSNMADSRLDRNAHPAIIYGPGCGPDGITLA